MLKEKADAGLHALRAIVVVGNLLYGAQLVSVYARAALWPSIWPTTLDQQVVWLVALSVLPLAVLGLWRPLMAGILEFATAFLGNQMLHDAPYPGLRLVSSISMAVALVILGLVVFSGIVQVTREAFGEAEDLDEQQARGAA